MKHTLYAIMLIALALIGCAKPQTNVYQNPIFPKCGPDPWALFYNGNYYYMHTMGNKINLWVTSDITDVKNAPCKTIWTPKDSSNMFDVWAPEIHRINGKWYVYYAADDGNTDNHQMYVLENENEDPFEGEFVMKGRISTDPDNNWAIDGSVFEIGEDLYMVWSGWQTRRVDTETQCIWIAKMANPWTLASERVMISKPELEWERQWQNENGWNPPYTIYVNEGPQPLLSPDGKLIHVAYSASGCWTRFYALGMLTANTDADLLDPASWQKSQEPVFKQKPEAGVYGTGHNSFFQSPDGKESYILYHARTTEADLPGAGDSRSPRMQRFEWDANGYPIFGEPISIDSVLVKPSGTIPMEHSYQPAGDKIMTTWGENIDPKNVLPEYPRPSLVRPVWQNLNGFWKYAIREKGQAAPKVMDGDILVPYCLESALSGVGKTLPFNHVIWYERELTIPRSWKKDHVLLHFGAVDWQAAVYVNGQLAAEHTGGYTPFSVDITPYLQGRNNTLSVCVYDPSDCGYQPRGKQVNRPEGIWYTPVSGIWQTVWMEPVPEQHIAGIKITPDLKTNTLQVAVNTSQLNPSDHIMIQLMDGKEEVAKADVACGETAVLEIENPHLWSTDDPFLYDVYITLARDYRALDMVQSYAAMRSITKAQDAAGLWRMQLNGKNLFQYGPLDQGWWPDGLYTAPSDEALLYDIQKTKDLGFNMIRKHVKVEPERWYYYCDKLGMLVWQDMPSGDLGNKWSQLTYEGGTDRDRSPESILNYYHEWKEIMDFGYNHPCIVVWVPFNEAWGQFKTVEVVEWTKNYDPTRLVNPASGGNHVKTGDILDLHKYPAPAQFLFDPDRVNVLGEYGGIGLPLEDHLWVNNRNWGYIKFTSSDEVTTEYIKYAQLLAEFIPKGFSAAVYTQTSDVEVEVNGLMTYDRKVVKVNEDAIRQVNQYVISQLGE